MTARSAARRAVAGAALALLGMVPVPPADIDTSFLLVGGTLSISAPAGPVGLGATPGSAVPGVVGPSPVGNVTVTDQRGLLLAGGWVASVRSSPFTRAGTTIAASRISYGTPVATRTGVGSLILTRHSVVDLTQDRAVQVATLVLGDNTATWNPTISVAVPGGAPAGTYTATLTHSVL
ncbi:hypothetical protein ACVGOW_25250 [Pseudonocardia saturnea]